MVNPLGLCQSCTCPAGNPKEICGDGIDNDGNGKVDDCHGWDFISNDKTIFDGSDGSDVDSHGTHVAGAERVPGLSAFGRLGFRDQELSPQLE